MFDHICQFPDEAAAIKALPQFYIEATVGVPPTPGGWNQSLTIPNVQAYRVTGTHQAIVNGPGGISQTITIEDRDYLPGWRIAVSLPALDKSLEGLELAFDRSEADKTEQPFVVTSVYAPEVLAGLTFSPVYAGSKSNDRVVKVREEIAAITDAGEKTTKAETLFTEEAKAEAPADLKAKPAK